MTILGLGRIGGDKPMSADERAARELHPLAFETERKPVNELDRQWREFVARESHQAWRDETDAAARVFAQDVKRCLIEQAAQQEDARAFAPPQSDPGDETDADERALAEAEAQFERAFGEPADAPSDADADRFFEYLNALRGAETPVNPAPTPIYVDRKGEATAHGDASNYTTYTAYSGNGGWHRGDEMEAAYCADTRETLMDDEPAEDERIQCGDVVQLIIGGPLMLIRRIDGSDRTADCVWFDLGNRYDSAWFPLDALEHA